MGKSEKAESFTQEYAYNMAASNPAFVAFQSDIKTFKTQIDLVGQRSAVTRQKTFGTAVKRIRSGTPLGLGLGCLAATGFAICADMVYSSPAAAAAGQQTQRLNVVSESTRGAEAAQESMVRAGDYKQMGAGLSALWRRD